MGRGEHHRGLHAALQLRFIGRGDPDLLEQRGAGPALYKNLFMIRNVRDVSAKHAVQTLRGVA